MAKTEKLGKRSAVLSLALALMVGAGCSSMKGQPAPAFSLPESGGATMSLADLKGSPVVVSFWATWCGPCQRELPELHRFQKEMGDKVTVLLVSTEPSADTSAFLREKNVDLWSLTDANGAVHRDYQVSGIPSLFVIDGTGVIRQHHVGYRPGVADRLKDEIASL